MVSQLYDIEVKPLVNTNFYNDDPFVEIINIGGAFLFLDETTVISDDTSLA